MTPVSRLQSRQLRSSPPVVPRPHPGRTSYNGTERRQDVEVGSRLRTGDRSPLPRRRYGAAVPVRAVIALLVVWLSACAGTTTTSADTPPGGGGSASSAPAATAAPTQGTAATTSTAPSAPVTTALDDGLAAADRRLVKTHVITGGLTPKSVVASGAGHFVAQNMMYSHTINVYDRNFAKVATIDDRVTLADWGFTGYSGTQQGGPVEAAFSPDGRHAYVSNYQMYGAGFSRPGNDKCSKGAWDPSFVYRIDTGRNAIDQVIEVGPVPKYVATTPDGRYVLVTNWCGYDLSVIDAAQGKEVNRIPIGRFPRGIAVTPDSATAYVAVMGSSDIAAVDLSDFGISWIKGVGAGPRHLVIDHEGRYLYATLNAAGQVAKIDLANRTVVKKVSSPSQPRSMAISEDGTALYVVNYASDAMSKIRTADMTQVQRLPTNHHPIGITYDPPTRQVWVACYSGSIMVFTDSAP